MKKKHTSYYITKELRELRNYLVERDEVPNTLFLRRAIRVFLEGKHDIDSRILITERTHPQYIKRDVCDPAYIDIEQYEALERIGDEKGCNVSQLIFQALVDYCAMLVIDNPVEISIARNKK